MFWFSCLIINFFFFYIGLKCHFNYFVQYIYIYILHIYIYISKYMIQLVIEGRDQKTNMYIYIYIYPIYPIYIYIPNIIYPYIYIIYNIYPNYVLFEMREIGDCLYVIVLTSSYHSSYPSLYVNLVS